MLFSKIHSEIAEGLGLVNTNYYVGIVRDALDRDVWRRVGDGVAVEITLDNWFSESSYNLMSSRHVVPPPRHHNKIVSYPPTTKYYFVCEYF